MLAPTCRKIVANGARYSLSCDPCRALKTREDLPARLIMSGRGDTPIDRLTFKCSKCGTPGQPMVTRPGNGLMGRERLWPPVEG